MWNRIRPLPTYARRYCREKPLKIKITIDNSKILEVFFYTLSIIHTPIKQILQQNPK